ncbi:MAG: LysR family transcriptional regulator [Gammaproteobacteria bacterium]|nr:LysR family transcriptional regulator [Gammaproteobacteria bacterium]
MDVKVFRTFLEVANTRHFGRAADNLYITQAAVSARIKQLEEYVGAILFERVRNNINLTPAGERMLPYATTMVRVIEQIKNDIPLVDSKLTQFSVAATPNIWDAFFQSHLNSIAKTFPELVFKTEMLNNRQLQASILDNTLDLALMFDPFLANEVNSEALASIELILVSSQPDQTATQAMESNYVYVDWGVQFATEHNSKHGRTNNPKLTTSTIRIALDFILSEGGAAYLPCSLIEPYLQSKELFKVSGAHMMQRTIFAVYQNDSVNKELIQSVLAEIK